MEMRHLRVFLVLAEELHFGRTATRMRVAQSAVSLTIKTLEEEVGAQLFARTKRHVSLTAAGRELAAHARSALGELERGAIAARRAASGESGRLLLRFTMMSALTVLPRAVARFQQRHPGVEIRIDPGGSTEQLEALGRGACDIAFVSFKRDAAPFAAEVVEKSTLVAIVPAAHPLARRKTVGLASFGDQRCIFLSERNEPGVRSALRRHFAELGVDPEVVLEVDQLESMLAFVAVGFGISLGPAFVERIGFRGVKCVPIRPAVPCGISAVWDPRALSPVARGFLATLREERDGAASSPV
jgi:DNA-binding transcriptional LysR family regulator